MGAFEPSKCRNKNKGRGMEKAAEPDMLPIMNLMVVLIPVLLSAAEMVKIRALDVNLPVSNGGGAVAPGDQKQQELKEEQQNLSLILTITKKGYFIGSKGGFLSDIAEFKSLLDGGIVKDEKGVETRNPDIMSIYDPKWEEKGNGSGFSAETYEKVTRLLVKLRNMLEEKNLTFPDIDKITLAAENDIDYQTVVATIDAIREYTDEEKNLRDLFPLIELGGF